MARGRTNSVMVTRVGTGPPVTREPDRVAVEEAMEVRLDDRLVATTMRTPGHDYELACGFLHTEGLLAGAPVRAVRYCATGPAVDTGFNVVSVDTGGRAPEPTPRLGTTTSACGACGSASPEALAGRLTPCAEVVPVQHPVAWAALEEMGTGQELFAATGAVHGAAAYHLGTGALLVHREDVGRHNAVDKVVGRLLLDGRLPAADHGLLVSGRVSFEIVQKAWAAGLAQVVAVGGATSLAVDTARRANLALAGFLGARSMTVYVP